MNTSRRFWRSASLTTGGMLLLLLLYGVYATFTSQTGMSLAEKFASLVSALPIMLAAALPGGAFVGGFSAAPEVFESREPVKGFVIGVGGSVMALTCLAVVGYVFPLLSAVYGNQELYLHELPSAWREALAQAEEKPENAPMRWYVAGGTGWDLFARLFWSLLVGLMAGIGLLSGYWARWTSNRHLVALQAWMIALLLALAVIPGVVLGQEFAQYWGTAFFGAWQIIRVPLLVLIVLSWPTWLSLRSGPRATHSPSEGAAA